VRHTQRERGVPSSANWKPTNPFKSKHQKVTEISPRWTPVKYYQSGQKNGKGKREGEKVRNPFD
jgi:hypothetical protein